MRGKKARDGVKVKVEARAQDAWDLLLWVKGAQVHKAVAAAMQTAMAAEGVDGRKGEVAQEWVRSLPSRSALSSVMRTDALLDSLVDTVWTQIEALKAGIDTSTAAGPSSSADVYSKFVAEGIGFKLNFGNLSTFFGGLEAKIGSPDPMVFDAMQREHQFSSDSRDFFTTGNYGVTTTPFIEWNFVAAPHDPPEGGWPVEARLQTGRPEDADRMRRALTWAELTRRRERISSRLRALGEPELIVEEMFVKYNDLLRNFGPALAGCKGNTYVTTTHVINSCIVKVAKLTKAAKVYRGISGGMLPEEFWTPNQQGIRGGVESAFMSTTYDRSVAMHYASQPGKPSLLFEIQMGMVDRGCELDWISQYPHEKEVLFNPLTGLEVLSKRFEGLVLVVEIKLSVNLNALTIEQVVGKRKKLLVDMTGNMAFEVRSAAPSGAADVFARLLKHTVSRGALDERSRATEWYNEDPNFKEAVDEVMRAKANVLDPDMRCELMSALELRRLGHTATELRSAGYVAGVKAAGYTFLEAVAAGYSDVEMLKRAGFAPCPIGGGLTCEHDWGVDETTGEEGGRCTACSERRFAVNADLWRAGAHKLAESTTRAAEGFNMLRPFPDDSRIVGVGSADSKNAVTVYNADLSVAGVLEGHPAEVRSVAVDEKHIASGDSRGGIRIWKTRTLELEGRGPLPMEHGGKVFGLALSGDVLISGAADKMAKVWSISDRACKATLTEHSHYVFCVDLTDAFMATASHDKTVRVWPDAASLPPKGGKSLYTLVHPDLVVAIEMERDVLATACEDRMVRTFNLTDGQRTRELRGHDGLVVSVAICGSVLLSGSIDATVKVWSLDTNEESPEPITTIEGQTGPVKGVALSPAGGFAASMSAGDAGKLIVWKPASLNSW